MTSKDEVLAAMRLDVGVESEPGAWLTVDQDLINRYVAISGEDVWIHTDPQRAAQSKFGTTIAPGNMGIALMLTTIMMCVSPVQAAIVSVFLTCSPWR